MLSFGMRKLGGILSSSTHRLVPFVSFSLLGAIADGILRERKELKELQSTFLDFMWAHRI